MKVRKLANGKYYVVRSNQVGSAPNGRNFNKSYRDWWLIKSGTGCHSGRVPIGAIIFPKEWIGKKVRLVVEVEDD